MASSQLHLGVALDGAGYHPAAWRVSSVEPSALFTAAHYLELTRRAESAQLDFVTLDDSLGLQTGGEEAVRGYFAASRIPFPDQANEIIAIGASGDSVLVEFWLTGTHLGPLRTPKGNIAPTGKAFRVRMMASFEFAAGSDNIICERPYFDRRAVIAALGLG